MIRHRCTLQMKSQPKKPVQPVQPVHKSNVGPFHTCVRCEKTYICEDVECTAEKGLCSTCKPIMIAKAREVFEKIFLGFIPPGGLVQ